MNRLSKRGALALATALALVTAGLGAASASGAPAAAGIQLVRVSTPTVAAKDKLSALGLDLTESAGPNYVDVVVHGASDAAALKRAGFTWQTRVADMTAQDTRARAADRAFAAKTSASSLPSGRTSYRTLGDYQIEMATLARRHPGLVSLFTLPERTVEGRKVYGIEIGHRVKARDGRPVFLILGLHHAREWPSGELTMEFGYDLVNHDGKDPQISRLLDQTRVILVPVVNPDGFDKSRGGDGQEMKRKNCRVTDGKAAPPPLCSLQQNWALGVDINRNYGFGWGGTGSSTTKTDDDYHGAGPSTEPEVRNIEDLISGHQVTTMITNHTFGHTVLRPPFTHLEGDAPDEAAFKALSDKITAQNGYRGLKSGDDYETTGETPDWSYYATRGLGYTIESDTDAFHPAFTTGVIDEYFGTGATAGKGNRGAFMAAWQNAADRAAHSVIAGRAPAGARLRIAKSFTLWTSPPKHADGTTGKPIPLPTHLESTMVVPRNGHFVWDVNPSIRPQSPFSATGEHPASGFVKESWTLTCTTWWGGHQTVHVTVDRGQQVKVDLTRCAVRL